MPRKMTIKEEFPPSYMVEAARAVVETAQRLGVDPRDVGAPLAAAMREIRHEIARGDDPESYVVGLMTVGDDPLWVLKEAGLSPNRPRRRSSKKR